MTDLEAKFLRLAVIELKTFDEIAAILSIERKQVSTMYRDLEGERKQLTPIRDLWKRKCKEKDFWSFKTWFEQAARKCHYCGITQDQVDRLFKEGKINTKRTGTRGRNLELERVLPNENYDNLENLVFSCYWCNNAKSDEFTKLEFQRIGEAISEIWKERANTKS